jgi:hypothetical protein
MKKLFALALCAFASLASADTIGTYGDTTVVTGPDSNPAWQLTSDSTGPNAYSAVYVTVTGPLTPDTLTELEADYVMLTGTFGGGAPRFSLIDTTSNPNNEAYIYFGTPTSGGTFTDPNNGNTNYANTGNYADSLSSDVRVYSNGFGGYGDGNTGQTWAQFLADPGVGTTQIGYISLDLDGGFTGSQVMDTTDFNVNGTIYAPSASPIPEPAGLGLMACVFAAMAGAGLRRRRV